MANFIGLVYATLQNEGIDTKGMSSDEAIAKYNELRKSTSQKMSKQEGREFIDNIYSYLKTKPSNKELYAKMESAGINKSGIEYYDTIAPMSTIGERANLIERIYRDKDFRK